VSETDSFINEVTDEVRRDKLFAYIRRYGWVAVLAILALVGGAAWREYSLASARSLAQGTGDALLAAMEQNDLAARSAALAAVPANGKSVAVDALLTAASQEQAGDVPAAIATLNSLAIDASAPDIYRSLATLKATMLDTRADPATRRAAFAVLGQPGGPFALLAQEQLALMDVAEGKTDEALAALQRITEDAGVSRGLRERAQNLIVALGGDIPAPATDPTATEPQTTQQPASE
jgi:hypothetical protein